MPQIKGKQIADNSIALAKLQSDVTDNFPPAGSSSQVYYVSKGGDDGTGDGSIAKPFLTIGEAQTQAIADFPYAGSSTEQVTIVIQPGSYGSFTATRLRTLFVCDDRDTRAKSVIITGPVTVTNSESGSSLFDDVIAFDGISFQNPTVSAAAVTVDGTEPFTAIFNNCEIVNSVAGSAGISCQNTSASPSRAIVRMRFTNVSANEASAIYASTGNWFVNFCGISTQGTTSTVASAAHVFGSSASTAASLSGNGNAFTTANPSPTLLAAGVLPTDAPFKINLATSTIANANGTLDGHSVTFSDDGIDSLFLSCSFSKAFSTAAYFKSDAVTGVIAYTGSCNYLGALGSTFTSGNVTNSVVPMEAMDSATGDLSGRLPSPTVVKLQGLDVSSSAPNANDVLTWDGFSWAPAAPTGTAYTAGDGLELATTEFKVKVDGNTIAIGAGGTKANALATGTLEQTPSATTGDEQPTGVVLASEPTGAGLVHVFVNGVRVSVGDGVKTEECYFAVSGSPATAINFSDLGIGDELHWNGTIAGYDLDTGDKVSFLFLDTTS